MTLQVDSIRTPSPLARATLSQKHVPTEVTAGSRRIWKNLGLVVILFLSIWFLYRSSLAHAPRSDQWSFLLDTIDQHDFVEIFSRTYSYNRMREVGPGDYHLFRPGLFALLSAEKALFGNNFAAWQWVGIVLHFVAVCLALQVMLRMQRLVAPPLCVTGNEEGWFTERLFLRVLPYALVLFWGMNFAISEVVIYSHINGYMLFLDFVLGGLVLLLEYWANPEAFGRRQALLLAGGWLLLLLSAFTHELGQLFAVAVAIVLALAEHRRGRLRRGLLLLSLFAGVLLLYQTVNFLDKKSHPGAQPDLDYAMILKQAATPQSIDHAWRYVAYTTVQPFFPSCATWEYFAERLELQEPRAVLGNYWRGGPILIISYLAVGAGLLLAARGLYYFLRGHCWMNRVLLLLPIALFAGHLALTVFGRMNMRPGPRALSINSYYTYVPLLALVMGVCLVWNCVRRDTAHKGSALVRSLHGVFLGGLVILTLCSGEQVCAINVAVKKNLRPLHATSAWLSEFIHSHEREADFSFAFDEASYDDMEVDHGVPWQVILFKQHLNNLTPKYIVSLRGSKCSTVPYEMDRAAEGKRQLFPDLIKVGTDYNIYYFEGLYYGVRGDDGYYRPNREEYQYLITDRTLEGALGQVPAKLREREADHRTGVARSR
jgi:hypothetical protein